MTNKLLVFLAILPDAHGGAQPQVALMVFHDVVDGFPIKHFCVRKWCSLVGLWTVVVESFVGAKIDVAIVALTHAVDELVF